MFVILKLSLMQTSWHWVPCVFASKGESEVSPLEIVYDISSYSRMHKLMFDAEHLFRSECPFENKPSCLRSCGRLCIYVFVYTLTSVFCIETGYSWSNHKYLEVTE